MIETSDARELFTFFVEDLSAYGYRLDSLNPETRSILEAAGYANSAQGLPNLNLEFSLDEFSSTLHHLGLGSEFMWPGATTASAGLRLLLTHLDEQRATKDLGTGDLTLTLRDSEPVLTAG